MNRLILSLSFLLMSATLVNAQDKKPWFGKRYINSIMFDTAAPGKPKFLIYPTIAFSPETSWEIGASSLLLFHAKRNLENRLSEIQAFTFFTLNKQYGVWLEHALYTDRNQWFFLGAVRFQSYPLLYYGIGPDSPSEHLALVEANYLIIKERALRKVRGSLYAGAELEFLNFSNVDFVPGESQGALDLPLGNEGSTNLSAGLGIIFDDRHNVLNVRDGNFFELAFLHSNTAWGSSFTFSNFISDNRIFRPIRNGRDVFAAQLFAQFTGGNVPFNQLALMGGERLMRGYYLGRYRDRNQLAAQVEYRFLPVKGLKRWGGAAFIGTGNVFSREHEFALKNFKVAGGLGLRFLIFPEKDIYTRFDVAMTSEGPGFYLFIGEAF